MKWGFILAAGLLAMWAMQNTAIGQQAVAALGSVTDLVKQQVWDKCGGVRVWGLGTNGTTF